MFFYFAQETLDYCDRHELLDCKQSAAGHVVPEIIEPFLAELRARVSSVTVARTITKVRRTAELINPARDLDWLKEIESELGYEARPRQKHHRIAETDRIVAGGLKVMDDVLDIPKLTWNDALDYRDALMVALCAMCPIRLKNITQLRIGTNFVDCDDYWLICLQPEETKEGRLDERRVPDILKSYIDRWIRLKKELLPPSENALWVSRYGGAIGYWRIEKIITDTTEKLTGKPINPHLLRDCAVHFVAVHSGDQMGIASGVLNHTDLQTTEKHYNKGSTIKAAQTYQHILLSGAE